MFEQIAFWTADLVIPLILTLTGFLCLKYPMKKINSALGYRTRRSMSSQEAWDYANERFPKIYIATGLVLFVLYTADKALALWCGADLEVILTLNVIIGIIGCLLPIPIIEKELKVLNTKSIEKENHNDTSA